LTNSHTDIFTINGGYMLSGKTEVNGSKNAALYAIAAALLTNEKIRYYNIPDISDIDDMLDILKSLGANVSYNNDYLEINANSIDGTSLSKELSIKIRASILVLGPLIARFGEAECFLPGGDAIGNRPIDIHIAGLMKLGTKVNVNQDKLIAKSTQLSGSKIVLDYPSVLGTINLVFAAVLANGTTIITNVATEPEVTMLLDLLILMGANITGSGSQTLTIIGVKRLFGTELRIIPDRIEAGTLMMAIAATRGTGTIFNVCSEHMSAVIEKFKDANIIVMDYDNSIMIDASNTIKSVNVQSVPYPGFPTDLQAPMAILLTQADGTSIIHERVFDNRMLYINEINLMGANIKIDKQKIFIDGPKKLHGGSIKALDVRAGAAAIIAGLAAEGETIISDLFHLDRGYGKIEDQLKHLGAKILRK
jgi:UDP-N-acetylglucosamine 1-carboxyvinyltransferase